MNPSRKRQIFATAILVVATALSFLVGLPEQLVKLFSGEDMAAFLLFLSTGRLVQVSQDPLEPPTEPTLPPAEIPPQPPALFRAEQAASIDVHSETAYTPDTEALLLQPLQWQLISPEPTVLILHTHATEAYTPTPDDPYTPSSQDRTLDIGHNMVRIGDYLADLLRQEGMVVLHDTNLHDYPSYTGSYADARQSIEAYLDTYPSLLLVLDLHRDAVDFGNGQSLTTHYPVNGVETARLMMVVGSDDGGLDHPRWRENLSLALKLHAQLEAQTPGICRFLSFRQGRFNQDLLPGAMLIEVGAAGDTLPQALEATKHLAAAITALAGGAQADSAG